jgi:hypothetical protein
MTKAEIVAEEFQLAMAFRPGRTYADYWADLDPFNVVPWDDISTGWGLVEKSMVPGSGVRYTLA